MKHALLITAYKNFEHLIDIINFYSKDIEIYIHIDKKSKITNKHNDRKFGRGGYPAILDKSDFDKIELSNNLFARKFEAQTSDLLKEKLKKHCST